MFFDLPFDFYFVVKPGIQESVPRNRPSVETPQEIPKISQTVPFVVSASGRSQDLLGALIVPMGGVPAGISRALVRQLVQVERMGHGILQRG